MRIAPLPEAFEPLACVEVGGSSTQTVVFSAEGRYEILAGAHQPPGARLALAVPGYVSEGRVLIASNLDWFDADPVEELGLAGPAELVLNDGEAAALGEAELRDAQGRASLAFVSLGTGVGGAVVADGLLRAGNLFGHMTGFSDRPCLCGQDGCLETVAAGWALPDALDIDTCRKLAAAVAEAVEREPLAAVPLVVVGGGLTRRYPRIVDLIGIRLPGRQVEGTAAPLGVKSAAAWGLRRCVLRDRTRRPVPVTVSASLHDGGES